NGKARIDIQRHGNCTKRSFGRNSQRKALSRSIVNVAAAARSNKARHTLACRLDAAPGAALRYARSAAMPVVTIRITAAGEAIQLKRLCSGSLIVVYRKFCEGSRPEDKT